ncbi:bacteriohemerythrin [Heliobacillus mobilis]|uniref:Bacteriohemerythrin n=1 Tax=Heliobacterium mobile TaxID=28064 RepID=A0A6I3SS34_HELMO|nr:bacteriohemerythrin [Heliobacterium mobile]MTV50867.1 bacteriohemerythrin [Heliobacterium mobile]
MFKWDEKYRVGIKQIDEQHQELFRIASKVYTLLKEKNKSDKFDDIIEVLEELQQYTVYHFKEEEDYMRKINFSGYAIQKEEHDMFIEKFKAVETYKIDENQEEFVKDLLYDVSKWIIHHILEEDMKIGRA